MKRLAAALLILLGAAPMAGLAGGAPEVSGRQVLMLDDLPPPGGAVWIEVRTGPLPKGAVLHLSTPGGAWSTALVAFGTQGAARYQVAVPATATAARRLELDVRIALPDEALRAPRPQELIGITVLPP